MASQKTTAAKLGEILDKILDAYAEEIQDDMAEVTDEVAKAGAKTLRSVSKVTFGGTGRYAKGWTVETTGKKHKQLVSSATIYNTMPGLPHLLEHGFGLRDGGRWKGRAHIAPVEKQITEAYTQAVEGALRR